MRKMSYGLALLLALGAGRYPALAQGEIAIFKGHADRVFCVAFTPDGKTLASCGEDGTVRLWDMATSRLRTSLAAHEGAAEWLAVAPDGKSLASAGGDGRVRLWSLPEGQARASLPGHSGVVTCVAWSPDGAMLASCGMDGTIRLWEAAAGRALGALEGHSTGVFSLAWSPDGKLLASAGSGGQVLVWDVAARRRARVIPGHTMTVFSVAFSPDGKQIATASEDRTVRLWSLQTGEQVEVLRAHEGAVRSLAWSADGKRIASASDDGTARLWDRDPDREFGLRHNVLRGHGGAVRAVAWSRDGQFLATASWDNTVRLWEIEARKLLHSPPQEGTPPTRTLGGFKGIRGLAFSPDGRWLVVATGNWIQRDLRWDDEPGGEVRLWDLVAGAAGPSLSGFRQPVAAVAISPDGKRLATRSLDGALKLWDFPAGRLAASPREGENGSEEFAALTYSPDGQAIAEAVGSAIGLRHGGTGVEISSFSTPDDGSGSADRRLTGVAFSPDGRKLAAARRDGRLLVWNVASRRLLADWRSPLTYLECVAFSRDGSKLAAGGRRSLPGQGGLGGGGAHVWDSFTGQILHEYDVWKPEVHRLAFSPDGALLALGWSMSGRETPGGTTEAGEIQLLDARNGRVAG